jgi:hypothetical protein
MALTNRFAALEVRPQYTRPGAAPLRLKIIGAAASLYSQTLYSKPSIQ